MTAFDYLVLLIVGVAAVGGFMRGFLQEVLSLAAWVLAAFAIRALHTPLTLALQDHIGTDITTALLAFTLLLLIPYAAMKVIANNVGSVSRNSMLGPVDRVLGFGFGALKGTLITTARSYELVDSSSRALVEELAERRARLRAQAADES